MPDRAALKEAFLRHCGWEAAHIAPLAGDASDRSYDRLALGEGTAVLMNAPPGKGDDPGDFLRIARHLRRIGLSAPEILAQDLAAGFLLLEDLGDGLLGRCIAADPALEPLLYTTATDVLLHLQAQPAPPGLPDLTAADWAEAAMPALEWYRFAATGERPDPAPLRKALTDLLLTLADAPRVLILRDYHAENLLFLPHRSGLAQIGLLDFQLAQMGQPGYDLVSLLQDARREVPEAVAAAMIARFARATPDDAAFRRSCAVLGVQRALRILGVFARLCLVGGKPGYLALMPRVWQHLQRNLATPGLHQIATLCDALLPEPTPATLVRIGSQCAACR